MSQDATPLLRRCLDLHHQWSDSPVDDGYKLSFYDEEKGQALFVDVRNTPTVLQKLRDELNTTGVSYRFVVLAPKERYTNINILDIGI